MARRAFPTGVHAAERQSRRDAHVGGRRGAEGSPRGALHETDARRQQLQSTLAANDPNRAAKEPNALCDTYRTFGFDELSHLCQALHESCSAKFLPQEKAIALMSSLSSEVRTSLLAHQEQLSARDRCAAAYPIAVTNTDLGCRLNLC